MTVSEKADALEKWKSDWDTFLDDIEKIYGCEKDGRFILRFFEENNVSNACEWHRLSKLRSSNTSFNEYLKSTMTLIVDYPEYAYPNLNSVWDKFMDIFQTVADLIAYKPIWQEYFYQVLKELYEDNVMYLEFRGILPEIYDLEGNVYDGIQVVGLYYETLQKFKTDYPAFHGARFIYAPRRKVSNQTVNNYVQMYLKLKDLYPDFIAGFDLVGQEDLDPVTAYHTDVGCGNWSLPTSTDNALLWVLYYRLRHLYGIDETPVLPYAPGDIESVVGIEKCLIY
ncbi:hypothetical protein NQ317_000324 [Molorchus minor]|uniref:Uncharacterized protein n=1 Tax=Molorchus minor TaxID=1323400 RepID=A0ABQ9JDJ2_9CUCU|nr:hypothetical protein NQ317_000324 [Molorchus minor]